MHTPAVIESAQPLGWARKWHADGEKPRKERNENGRMVWVRKFTMLPVTEHQIFADDVPLYARANIPPK